ncbi:TPA: hypothetical protein ACRRC6_004875 [Klebsiella pneumoniae]|uniref:hypothetical protein n=1 Tax=Enterobacteriaceae TaxID=543 RepID=UPI002073CF54|nr:hypothetical protein [Enterobacter bugandensis]HBQ1079187.1 hypothetical protein [Klebsiella pneumoniae]HBU9459760.1 hypothetical protein [Klebsiella pneumoniae]HBV7394876.1 hypothetical protein [Klebsiella pneumoniae]HBV7575948.1 hypothetical protein [Klebsiella pneumoniae]
MTEELARRIAKMVSLFPDSQIPVTWENVMTHSKKKFGHAFNRQMLSQKQWRGRKLIAEAFSEAKNIQRRMQNDTAPKYKTAARSVLQKKISELEAKNLALREELETVRAQQVDKLDTFLNTIHKEIDLRKLLYEFYEAK